MTMFVGLQVSVFPLLSEYRFLHLTETYRSRIVVPRSFVQRFLFGRFLNYVVLFCHRFFVF